jgi:hypothetical protein
MSCRQVHERTSSKHKSVHDKVLERGLVEETGREHHECVEPATGLIQAFGDEVRGEALLESVGVLEWVVQLGVRHGTGLEPTVEHLLDALERALASLGRDGHLVHVFLVQVGDADAGQLVEFLDGAHGHDLLLVVAHPDRDGRAPEAVPADGPVLRVRQPVVESTCTQHTNRPHNQIRLVQSPSLTIVPSLTKAGTQ